MIVPTNGRIVWYYPGKDESGITQHDGVGLAAQVCHVWHERSVNLLVTDSIGRQHVRTHTALLQDDDPNPGTRHAVWMPYQTGQAAKTAAAEAKVQGS